MEGDSVHPQEPPRNRGETPRSWCTSASQPSSYGPWGSTSSLTVWAVVEAAAEVSHAWET